DVFCRGGKIYGSGRLGNSLVTTGNFGKWSGLDWVIAINENFPGPILEATTNWNVVVNVKNDLDEPLLLTWNGIQHRKNSWQDGVLGTNCPIPAGWNWTYSFQVKDQIGSFFYFPSTNFQRAAGGFGGILVNNRDIIPVPFGTPDGDITLTVGDWFLKSHKKPKVHTRPRFVNSTKASGVAILHYSNSQGPASGPLPDLPNESDPSFSMNQAKSIRTENAIKISNP
nr:monocopper oxidase-like protein SKU5 isoform X1 [Tanacetum cinerariifolium]